MNLREYVQTHQEELKKLREEQYRRLDREVNGDDEYYKKIGEEIEKHPLGLPRARGGLCQLVD